MATRETPRGVEATGFWKNGAEFHGEFGRLGGDALGHSYQYGHYICDYYLESLGLTKIGGKGLNAAQEKPDPKK